MLKAIIFDMDGVLIDTEPIHSEVDILIAKQYGITITYDYVNKFIGSTMSHIFECMIRDFKIDATVSELINLQKKIRASILKEQGYPIVPGVCELVKNLYEQGYLLCVASSSIKPYIIEVTKELKIDSYFTKLVSGESVPNPKPAPDIFLKAAKELDVLPFECMVIEDSSLGVSAAVSAGMQCIGFVNPNSGNQDLNKANVLITSFSDIDNTFIENIYSSKL